MGLDMLMRFLSYQDPANTKKDFDIGTTDQYPIGSRMILNNIPAVLFHTSKGYQALSLICSHLGCTVLEENQGFTCPCHGSKFDSDGNVLQGPASKPLQQLTVEVSSNRHLILHIAE
jgi:cytochrome b6-f complex iron-sulfur subunit